MGLYSDRIRPRLQTHALNDRLTGEIRDRDCAGLTGDVLEIGYGAGLSRTCRRRSQACGPWSPRRRRCG